MDNIIQTCSGLLELINLPTTIPILDNDPSKMAIHDFYKFYERLEGEYKMLSQDSSLSEIKENDKSEEMEKKMKVRFSYTPSIREVKKINQNYLTIPKVKSPALIGFECDKSTDDINLLLKQLLY